LVDLWFDNGTHASKHGSYLAAPTLFGSLTGIDPWSFGANERAAADRGISQREALTLQQIASAQLHAAGMQLTRLACLHASPKARLAALGTSGVPACGNGQR
jgi:hypothetical protein